jgi:uncharacterized protein (DUF1684 family)
MTKALRTLPLLLALLVSCSKRQEIPALSAADSLAIITENLTHRTTVDAFMRSDGGSPFRRDTTVTYSGIRWFPIDPRFQVTSILHRYEQPETVIVMGTRGEQRRNLKYGYFEFLLPDGQGASQLCRINVYKFTPYDGQRYQLYRDHLSVWFTDLTTGKETYDVGRYVEVGIEFPDRNHAYVIDFNKAYNPYCAYSSLYSCAIPRQEDHIDVAINAGEKKYHE